MLALLLDLDVLDVLTDGEGHVARQRPGRGRPGQDGGAGLSFQLEAHVDAGIGRVVAIALRQLVAAERCGAARAVGRDPEALVDQALVPHLLERPPDRLDVARVVGPVGVVVVEPEGHPLAERAPVCDVAVDRLTAPLVEGGDAIRLDLLLAGDLELLLDLQLHRQPVHVPARLAFDVAALHRLVAPEDVLEGAGQDVVRARVAVGRRRAFVKDEAGSALADPQRFLERVVLLPEAHDLALQRGEVGPGADRFEQPPLGVQLFSRKRKQKGPSALGRAFCQTRGTTQLPRATTLDTSGSGSGVISFHRCLPPGSQPPGLSVWRRSRNYLSPSAPITQVQV